MTTPTSGHTARYRPGDVDIAEDGRMFSNVFLRNFPPLLIAVNRFLAGRSGPVLEIGCGTGQHAASFALAFPDLEWWPSDLDEMHRASANAWQAFLRAPARPALDVDGATSWGDQPAITDLGPLAAVFVSNVTHIAPFEVTRGILRGAAGRLAPDGILLIYGPFIVDGDFQGAGNERFDQNLRADNPGWGLRDTVDMDAAAREVGLHLADQVAMPANNRLLAFRRV